jgi:hypothetical protein
MAADFRWWRKGAQRWPLTIRLSDEPMARAY